MRGKDSSPDGLVAEDAQRYLQRGRRVGAWTYISLVVRTYPQWNSEVQISWKNYFRSLLELWICFMQFNRALRRLIFYGVLSPLNVVILGIISNLDIPNIFKRSKPLGDIRSLRERVCQFRLSTAVYQYGAPGFSWIIHVWVTGVRCCSLLYRWCQCLGQNKTTDLRSPTSGRYGCIAQWRTTLTTETEIMLSFDLFEHCIEMQAPFYCIYENNRNIFWAWNNCRL